MSHEFVEQQAKEERWLNKTRRIGGTEFNPNGGVTHPGYGGSIHVGTNYHPPLNLERTVEKDKWITKEPFYQAVPVGRIVQSRETSRGDQSRGDYSRPQSTLQSREQRLAAGAVGLRRERRGHRPQVDAGQHERAAEDLVRAARGASAAVPLTTGSEE